MFGDWGYFGEHLHEQRARYNQFCRDLSASKAKLLIIELGAGTAVPTVRYESQRTFTDRQWTSNLIRVNPQADDALVPASCKEDAKGQALELPMDALTALTRIDEAFKLKRK